MWAPILILRNDFLKSEPIRDEFLEKRKARQRKARKKRLVTSLIAIIVALVITAVALCLTVFFPITKINVNGSKIYTSDEVIANSGIKIGDNIFTFGEKSATKLLKSKLPFVENVEFIRNLPDTLTIKVSDAKVYYCVLQNGVYYNVSKAGWVLEKVNEKNDGVFEIKASKIKCNVGSEIVFEDEKSYKMLENTVKLLEENGIKIDYIDVSNKITIKAGVEGRFDVEFGTENYLENKIKHLKVSIENIDKNKKGEINLSMWNDQNKQGTFVENYIK